MSTAREAEFSWQQALVLVPLYGGTLAIAYDVGYFYRIGIEFFTLFSLTEHIVFAMPALPIGLLLSFSVPLGFVARNKGQLEAGSEAPKNITSAEISRAIRAVKHSIEKERKSLLYYAMGSAVIAALPAYFGWFSITIFFLLSALFALALWFDITLVLKRAAIFLFIGLSAIMVSFGIGVDVATLNTRVPARMKMHLTGSDMLGFIVRSGERGVLFYESESKKHRFVPWTDVKGFTSI